MCAGQAARQEPDGFCGRVRSEWEFPHSDRGRGRLLLLALLHLLLGNRLDHFAFTSTKIEVQSTDRPTTRGTPARLDGHVKASTQMTDEIHCNTGESRHRVSDCCPQNFKGDIHRLVVRIPDLEPSSTKIQKLEGLTLAIQAPGLKDILDVPRHVHCPVNNNAFQTCRHISARCAELQNFDPLHEISPSWLSWQFASLV